MLSRVTAATLVRWPPVICANRIHHSLGWCEACAQPYFEMEESRSVTPWVNRLYFESPRASSFLGLRLVKTRHKNLVPMLSGVKPDPKVRSGRHAEPIPVKSPMGIFTKYGQTVPRPDPTWGVGIAHFQLWRWRYPSCVQTVPFFSAWIYFPNTVKLSTQSIRETQKIYAPLAWITTDSGNGLVSSLCQATAWTNFDL